MIKTTGDLVKLRNVGPRTYFGRRAMIINFNSLLRLSIWNVLSNLLLRFRCFIIGHDMVVDEWMRIQDHVVDEYHIGCRRCPKFHVELPTT